MGRTAGELRRIGHRWSGAADSRCRGGIRARGSPRKRGSRVSCCKGTGRPCSSEGALRDPPAPGQGDPVTRTRSGFTRPNAQRTLGVGSCDPPAPRGGSGAAPPSTRLRHRPLQAPAEPTTHQGPEPSPATTMDSASAASFPGVTKGVWPVT